MPLPGDGIKLFALSLDSVGSKSLFCFNDIQKIIDKTARGEGRPYPCLASAVTLRNLWPGQAPTLALHNCLKIGPVRMRTIVTILDCITA